MFSIGVRGVLLLCFSFGAAESFSACIQRSNSVGLVGLDSGSGVVYAQLLTQAATCECSQVRFMPGNTKPEMAMSILLAAKLANKKVRVDIISDGDCNSANRVYLE